MHRYIWLVPLLPLAGAAINGLLGRKLRFSEKLIGGIAVGSIALAFLITVAAVYSYAFGGNAMWPQTYVTSQDGAFSFTWIPGDECRVPEQYLQILEKLNRSAKQSLIQDFIAHNRQRALAETAAAGCFSE